MNNKKYYIKEIDSKTACSFTAKYHYSHFGTRKAKLNLGVFSKDDCNLRDVLQWGMSPIENVM